MVDVRFELNIYIFFLFVRLCCLNGFTERVGEGGSGVGHGVGGAFAALAESEFDDRRLTAPSEIHSLFYLCEELYI